MNGAVSIINATATGRGASLAIEHGVTATWSWGGEDFSLDAPGVDDSLARVIWKRLQREWDLSSGASASTRSVFPPSRGLKTSSSAAAALVDAAAHHAGRPMSPDALIEHAIEASLEAGATITGAYDDQTAVVAGGCTLTDNRERCVLQNIEVEPWTVAVWVPAQSISKTSIANLDASGIAPEIRRAEEALLAGDVAGAMTINGAAFTNLYQSHGLPVTSEPARQALAHGALGAGLSGTGPAVAALFEPGAAPEIQPVPGGKWVLSRVVS